MLAEIQILSLESRGEEDLGFTCYLYEESLLKSVLFCQEKTEVKNDSEVKLVMRSENEELLGEVVIDFSLVPEEEVVWPLKLEGCENEPRVRVCKRLKEVSKEKKILDSIIDWKENTVKRFAAELEKEIEVNKLLEEEVTGYNGFETVNELEEENVGMAEKLKEAADRERELLEQVEEMREKLEEKEKIRKKEVDEIESREVSLYAIIELKDTEISSLEEAKAETDQKFSDLQYTLKSYTEEASHQIYELNHENNNLKLTLEEASSELIEKYKIENRLLEGRFNDLKVDNTHKDQELTLKVREIEELESIVKILRTEISEIKHSYSLLEISNNELKQQVDEHQLLKTDLEFQINQLENIIQREYQADAASIIKKTLKSFKLEEKFSKISDNVYSFNGKNVTLAVKNSTVNVVIGGGHIPLADYLRLFNEEPHEVCNETPRGIKTNRSPTTERFNTMDLRYQKFGDDKKKLKQMRSLEKPLKENSARKPFK